jgi:hypothetical protein
MRNITVVFMLVGFFSAVKAALPDASEFTRWRMEYADAPNALFSWAIDAQRVAALESYKHDKAQFVDLAIGWLKKCPIDARVRIMLASALSDLGRSRETIPHRYIYYGLLASIAGEADGLSRKTPFRVVSIDEEYDVCAYLGAQVLEQRIDGHFDVLTVLLKGKKQELYFDASIVFRNEHRSLQEKK